MRRSYLHLFPLIILISLSSATFSYGQAWSGILASTRAIDWTQPGLPASLPDGETTPNPWTPPTRSTICQTLSSGASASTINSAISACSSPSAGSVVLLKAGTYTVNSGEIDLYGKNVSLRGAGPSQTTIILNGGSFFMGRRSMAGSAAVTGGLSQGSTSITVSNASGISAGMIIQMYQCDAPNSGNPCTTTVPTDNGGIWICGFTSNCNIDGGSGIYRDQQQTFLVTHVSGTTLTISPGIYMSNWSTSQTATVEWNDFSSFPNIGLGLENLTIYTHAGGGAINIDYGYASWITGVRFIGSNTAGGNSVVEYEGNKNTLFANNYIYGLDPASPNYSNYIFIEPQRESDNLWLNNIYQVTAYRGLGHLEGDIIAYDYHRDTMANNASGFEENGSFQHYPGVAFVLNEGNQQGLKRDDSTWGTHNFDTDFREYLECYDVPFFNKTSTSLGLVTGSFARFNNAIGNAIGSVNTAGSNIGCTAYQSTGVGTTAFVINDGPSDTLTGTGFMRWGNVTTIPQGTDTPANSGIRFVSSEVPSNLSSPNVALSNPVPVNDDLPASFFLGVTAHPSGGTGLGWWKVCTAWTSFPSSCGAYTTQPFPTSGPDVTGGPYVNGHAYDIPAKLAWQYLPTDSTYQNSYTVTGSSYSGTTETLTVTIPGGWHIQGGFTPPAWSSACNPTSGLSYTGRDDDEILMTASTSTTISYELASNPGTSCTGTIKWPDVRQFDAAVYQADDSQNDPPAPPTGLAAVVQ